MQETTYYPDIKLQTKLAQKKKERNDYWHIMLYNNWGCFNFKLKFQKNKKNVMKRTNISKKNKH